MATQGSGELAETLARRLRALRTQRGLSQAGAAAAAGLDRNNYQLLESAQSSSGGPANPRLSTLVALAEAYGVSVADLLK